MWQSIVIGAGQAGLSTAYHLRRLGIDFVVLDANSRPGGAWQHRWQTLTMHDVHGVAALPGFEVPAADDHEPAREFVPEYFGAYEDRYRLLVLRPVTVRRVSDAAGLLRVEASDQEWLATTVVNATGTWRRPFVPYYPGIETFTGRQLHTFDYSGPAGFAGQHVVVVGGGHSAVQILAEISVVASTTWVTRRPPAWRTGPFEQNDGRDAVAQVEQRVRHGLPPQSVVSVTGLALREQEQAAAARGVYRRLPMFERIAGNQLIWADGHRERADVILWATGFRHDIAHLGPLHLRTAAGGIALDGTAAVRDPRVQLVGYGPSASTIGANRAGRTAALNVRRYLQSITAEGDPSPARSSRVAVPVRH